MTYIQRSLLLAALSLPLFSFGSIQAQDIEDYRGRFEATLNADERSEYLLNLLGEQGFANAHFVVSTVAGDYGAGFNLVLMLQQKYEEIWYSKANNESEVRVFPEAAVEALRMSVGSPRALAISALIEAGYVKTTKTFEARKLVRESRGPSFMDEPFKKKLFGIKTEGQAGLIAHMALANRDSSEVVSHQPVLRTRETVVRFTSKVPLFLRVLSFFDPSRRRASMEKSGETSGVCRGLLDFTNPHARLPLMLRPGLEGHRPPSKY